MFFALVNHDRHYLCLIFAGDVESDTSCVLPVVDDSDTNEFATQAGFLNASLAGSIEASQAGPCNVENINYHHEPVVSDGEFAPQQQEHNNIDAVQHFFDSFERLKKPDLESLAVAHGISMSDREMFLDDLRESIACHVGLGQCSSSNHSYQGCDSVREALGIQIGDGLEDSILAGKISFLNAVLTTTERRTLERLLKAFLKKGPKQDICVVF